MRAVTCRAWGPIDTLKVEEIAPPTPAADEVLIDVRATSVNYADAIMVAGNYQTRPPFPFSPGLETAGVRSLTPSLAIIAKLDVIENGQCRQTSPREGGRRTQSRTNNK